MKKPLRQSGLAVIPQIPWGTHLCLFYQSSQELLDVLIPYFKAGIENHEICVWVVSAPLTCEQAETALHSAFGGALPGGQDLEQQMVILPYEDWYIADASNDAPFNAEEMLGRWLERLDQALKSGFEGIRMAGNADWVRNRNGETGVQPYLDYERSVNQAINDYRMIALCEYPLNECRPQEIIEIVQSHQITLVKRDERWNAMVSSDYQKAQSALLENETKFSLVMEYSADGIVLIDPEGCITDWNPAQEQITGLSSAVALGKPVWEVERQLMPEWKQNADEYGAHVARVKSFLKGDQLHRGEKLI
jgi:PAS domain-containing protein